MSHPFEELQVWNSEYMLITPKPVTWPILELWWSFWIVLGVREFLLYFILFRFVSILFLSSLLHFILFYFTFTLFHFIFSYFILKICWNVTVVVSKFTYSITLEVSKFIYQVVAFYRLTNLLKNLIPILKYMLPDTDFINRHIGPNMWNDWEILTLPKILYRKIFYCYHIIS